MKFIFILCLSFYSYFLSATNYIQAAEKINVQFEEMTIPIEIDQLSKLVTYEADAKYGPSFGWTEENASKNAEVLASGLTSLENALSNGVNVGYGTDLCWSPKSYQGDGLLIHQEVCGAVEALRHCTVNNARIVRMEGEVGEIITGAHADLVILDTNPLISLECFSQNANTVVAVVKAGQPVRDDEMLFEEL